MLKRKFISSHSNREHDFNKDSRLDGLEILAAIEHSDMAHELSIVTANLTGDALKEATRKELKEDEGNLFLVKRLYRNWINYFCKSGS